jgi:hypothetical protein
MALTGLGPQLYDLALVLGVVGADGGLRAEWFADPLGHAGDALRDAARRDALRELIAAVIPPEPAPEPVPAAGPATAAAGSAGDETWHPLTGARRTGPT